MDINFILLVIAALAPAIILCTYIFIKDRQEKEPFGLLIKLLLFGVLSVVPVLIIGEFLGEFIDEIFSSYYIPSITGDKVFSDPNIRAVYLLVYFMIAVALVEEGCKYFFMYLPTRKNKEFNSLFDGIIYAVFVSLGFAAFENVLYVTENGFGNAIMRALLSVPGHMFYGVMMGYYYSMVHIYDKAKEYEQKFIQKGLISPGRAGFDSKQMKIKSLAVPVAAHGIYDFLCMLGSSWSVLALLAFVIYMYIHCFKKVIKMSKADKSDTNCVAQLLFRKYPDLPDKLRAASEQAENSETQEMI